ncbi:MAG: hypothetical protein IK094_04255, partial [Treponema sp.]|nr:hypothetical protein [Treponema sp.]
MAKKKDTEKETKTADTEPAQILPIEQILPASLNLLPIQGRPIFPGIFTPLQISNEDDQKTVEAA